MKSGMTYRQGSILLVPFPFTDLSTTKQRPVIVLSKSVDNEKSQDLIVCAITSKIRKWKYGIKISNSGLIGGNLPVESMVLLSKLFTIEKSLIITEFGLISLTKFKEIKKVFNELV